MEGQTYKEGLYELSNDTPDAEKAVFQNINSFSLNVDWTKPLIEFISLWCPGVNIPPNDQKYVQEAGPWYMLPLFYFWKLIPSIPFKYVAVRMCHKLTQPKLINKMRTKLMFHVAFLKFANRSKAGNRLFNSQITSLI